MTRCSNSTKDIEIGLLRIVRLCGSELWNNTFARLDEFAKTVISYPVIPCLVAELPRDEKKAVGLLLELSDDLQKRLLYIMYVSVFINKLRGIELGELSEFIDWCCVLNELDWKLFADIESSYFNAVSSDKGVQLILRSLNRHPIHPIS